MARTVLGDALAAAGDHAGAEAEYRRAADTLSMMSATRQAAQAWRDLGDRLMDIGRTEGALDAFQHAFDAVGLRPSSVRVGAVGCVAGPRRLRRVAPVVLGRRGSLTPWLPRRPCRWCSPSWRSSSVSASAGPGGGASSCASA